RPARDRRARHRPFRGRAVLVERPFGGPGAVLAYLSRYTHRIAIANSRLVAFDGERVTFKWKDYRAKADNRYKLMGWMAPSRHLSANMVVVEDHQNRSHPWARLAPSGSISRSTFSSSTGLTEPGKLFCAEGCAGAKSRAFLPLCSPVSSALRLAVPRTSGHERSPPSGMTCA